MQSYFGQLGLDVAAYIRQETKEIRRITYDITEAIFEEEHNSGTITIIPEDDEEITEAISKYCEEFNQITSKEKGKEREGTEELQQPYLEERSKVPSITVTLKELEERPVNIPMVEHIDEEWELQKAAARTLWRALIDATIWNRNRNHKEETPKCEYCLRRCYYSKRNTKIVCEEGPINWCSKCYNNELYLLEEEHNRRQCPNHEKCVAFESKADRTRYNNDEDSWEHDYFLDPTKCRIHQNVKLIGEIWKICTVCEPDCVEAQLERDEHEQTLYGIAAMVVNKAAIGRDIDGLKHHNPGALFDAFAYASEATPLQIEVRKNERRTEQLRKEASEFLDQIIPKEWTWIRKKIHEKQDQVEFEVAQAWLDHDEQPIGICMGCLSVCLIETMHYDRDLKYQCDQCIQYPELTPVQPEHNFNMKKVTESYLRKEHKRWSKQQHLL
jgi:hypothetical protein